jgi:hypothetical protein
MHHPNEAKSCEGDPLFTNGVSKPGVVGRVLAGGDRGIGGTVYGTVVALAALAAGAVEQLRPKELAVVVASTASVIWFAHVYAHGLGESIEHERRLDSRELAAIAVRELPILAAAAAPTSMLILGAVGLVQESKDIWLAFAVGLAALAVQGRRYARVEKLGPLGTAAVVASNLALGGLVVGLKVLVTHH